MGSDVKTIQIIIDEPLLAEVDRVIAELGTNRSAYFRDAAQRALQRHRIAVLEEQHRQGYAAHPQTRDEAVEWLPEQSWEA
jgi:metal-responsive CopG/Arc/MetJ family transcriptional regulator